MEKLGKFIGAGVLGGIVAYVICSALASSVRPSEWEPAIKAFGSFIVIFIIWGFAVEDI